jgi:hypothetical protein
MKYWTFKKNLPSYAEIGRYALINSLALGINVVTNQRYEKHGGYLPAYFHVAKGNTFTKALSLNDNSFDEQVYNIINDGRFTYKNEVTLEKAKNIEIKYAAGEENEEGEEFDTE